jgi:predicted amidohydrolase
MTRTLRVASVQAPSIPMGTPFQEFADDVRRVVANAPGVNLVVYPELHLFGWEHYPPEQHAAALREFGVPIDGELVTSLGALAAELGVWLLPGSICELATVQQGGVDVEKHFNTALLYAPDGSLRATYRKIFPWRPYEPYDPGDRFVVADLDGIGRIGLSICYDAWFPEVTRHLGWMGAEAVINIVKTTTPDRAQELVLARANSITNQTFTVSVNCAAPIGVGQSILVDPEGAVIESLGEDSQVIVTDLDLDAVTRVHEVGTAGTNRIWEQFHPGDSIVPLPLYQGRIEPSEWRVGGGAPAPASVPAVTSALPVVADAMPVVTSEYPVVTSALPVVTGTVPLATDAFPVVTSAIPVVTSAVPLVGGGYPATSPVPETTGLYPVVTNAIPLI